MRNLKIVSFLFFCLLCGSFTYSFGQRKTLIKENGVSIEYEIEYSIEKCDMKDGFEQVYLHRMTFYIVNSNNKKVKFDRYPSAEIPMTGINGFEIKDYTACYFPYKYSVTKFPTELSPNSEEIFIQGTTISRNPNSVTLPSSYNLPSFTLTD